ncbi:YybH family protein [Aliagarivorans marinus]|uniref:YybH family protein n=1 Tax=Aliagarivorans marinus TaxID=561965 RepID=UPI0003FEE77F|nr:nuclear transport factor 2 family protein [Aliagarivorans marinus]
MSEQEKLALCQQGIDAWKQAFNCQDAEGCAQRYMENATMHARPFGTFEGREAIQAFWQDIMDKGFKDVAYTDVVWELNEEGYILSSKWTMNNAYGVVHRELWVIDNDGLARLVSDDFEILGER